MISAVIFDVDGTLLDTETIYMDAWRKAAKKLGIEMSEEYLQKSRARNIKDTLVLFDEYFGDKVSFFDLRDIRVRISEEVIAAKTPEELLMPGVPETLDYLEKHGIKAALATSTEKDKTRVHLEKAGLWGRFPVIVTGDEVTHGKPDPEIFLTAAAKLGVSPEECAVAEDSPAGIEAASRAGMLPVFIPDKAMPTEDTYRRAAAVLNSMEKLTAFIEKKNQPDIPPSDKRQKLILISMDAMMSGDLEQAFEYNSYRSLQERGSLVKHVRTLFPAMTYPCHTAMLSGCLPHKSGIWNNYAQIPGKHVWNWYHDAVKCSDLLDEAKKTGLKTAAVSWPATGNHPSADWLVDEIWPEDKNAGVEDLHRLFVSSGTEEELYDSCVKQRAEMRLRRKQPDTSWFSTGTALEIIKKYSPDVLVLHLTAIDTFRHEAGVYGERAKEAVAYSADMLGEILRTLEERGELESTNIVVTSDHGQLDAKRAASPNVLLRKAGFIEPGSDGTLKAWKAWCFEAGNTAIVKIKDNSDKETENAVFSLFSSMLGRDAGFTKIWTAEEACAQEGLKGDFSFILQGDSCTVFNENFTGDEYFTPKAGGMHGHFPNLAPDPFLLAAGPAFKKGACVEKADITDVAPTCAAAIGIALPEAEGRAITAILSNS